MTLAKQRSFTTKTQRKVYRIQAGAQTIALGQQTKIMGIVNVTPDSFSYDGQLKGPDFAHRAVMRAKRLVKRGADIIDVGGESTRPGAKPVGVQEELRRVIPVISALAKWNKVPLSVDTYKADVAEQALDAGAVIINNIMGTKPTKRLIKMVARYNAAIVLMHIKGTPRTMQKNIAYTNVVKDIVSALKHSIDFCLDHGLNRKNIIIDPGIGFGKTVEDNLSIINSLTEFKTLDCPLLLGTSRKSFIGHVLDKEVNNRLYGSLATVAAGIINGAHIVRVHDVKETRQTALITDAIINEG